MVSAHAACLEAERRTTDAGDAHVPVCLYPPSLQIPLTFEATGCCPALNKSAPVVVLFAFGVQGSQVATALTQPAGLCEYTLLYANATIRTGILTSEVSAGRTTGSGR